jgi:hypothetical protein
MRRHIYYTLQSLLHKQGSNAIKIVSLALGLLMSVFLFARIAFYHLQTEYRKIKCICHHRGHI